MARRGTVWLLGVVVGILALVGIGASAGHYLQEPYNPGFLHFPTVVALHVVLGGVYQRLGTLLIAALAVAFVVHASVAETWIRATRRSGAPKAGKVKTV